MATDIKVSNYTLHFNGIHGRNRKAKRGYFHLLDVPAGEQQPTEQKLQELVAAKLLEVKAKPGSTWQLVVQSETITDYGNGLRSRAFMLFDGKKVLAGAV